MKQNTSNHKKGKLIKIAEQLVYLNKNKVKHEQEKEVQIKSKTRPKTIFNS
jgi:hypothetical protein